MSNSKTLVDLTYIHSKEKLKESVALYAFRFLKSLSENDKKGIVLWIVKSMEHEILNIVGNFNVEYFKDIPSVISRIPYIRGFLRIRNWKRQANKLKPYNYGNMYIPFSWTGNSCHIPINKIITIHDLRPMYQQTRAYSNSVIFKTIGLGILYKSCIRKYYTAHMRNAKSIIAISGYVAKQVATEWPEYIDKISTVYNSVNNDDGKFLKIHNLQERKYVLYVNTLTEYKNLETLVRAFSIFLANNRFKDLMLVIVGKPTEYWNKTIVPIINDLNIKANIYHIDYALDAELSWLYSNAALFVTTSLNEGFGYTPIEAALHCCPVISTRCESLPDVTAEKVAYYSPPTSADALFSVMNRLLDNPVSENELKSIRDFFKERYSENAQKRSILNLIKLDQ